MGELHCVGDYAAIVLAGGAGRRLGGVAKPLLQVGGRAMLDRVLDAVADARPRVVVGPASLVLPPGVLRVCEDPPGGGPVAALAAGLSTVDDVERVAVLAADLPFLTREAIAELHRLSIVDGALYVDANGRRQLLCGVWRTSALRNRLAEMPRQHGAALSHLLTGLAITEVTHTMEVTHPDGPPPWYDCDSPAELARAKRWS